MKHIETKLMKKLLKEFGSQFIYPFQVKSSQKLHESVFPTPGRFQQEKFQDNENRILS